MNQSRLILGVLELPRASAFYGTFFGCSPVRETADAVLFELHDPPLTLVLERTSTGKVTPIASQGLRLPDRAAVVAFRERLHRAGLKTHTQECTHCGYNEQFKVHVADPDGNYWSLYAVEEVIHPSAIHRCLEGPEAVILPDPVQATWEPVSASPERVPHPAGSLDEVRFPAISVAIAKQAFRALRPGGTVCVAVDMGDVPELLTRLRDVGFRGLTLYEGEIRGSKPDDVSPARTRLVIYKGPFRQVKDDFGNVYPRGQRVPVTEAAWTLLRKGFAVEQFLFLFPFGYPTRGPVRPPEPIPQEVGA